MQHHHKGNIMKKLIMSFCLIVFLASSVFARGKQDFDKFLKSATSNVTNYSSQKYYEKLEFTNKKTGQKKKFADFSEVDRFVLIVMQCDLLSHEMENLYNKWKEDLKTAEDTPDDESEAGKKEITQYMEKLLVLRKQNAENVERLVAELFKKWPDKFTKEEQEYVTKNIQQYHNKSDLIKRKK